MCPYAPKPKTVVNGDDGFVLRLVSAKLLHFLMLAPSHFLRHFAERASSTLPATWKGDIEAVGVGNGLILYLLS